MKILNKLLLLLCLITIFGCNDDKQQATEPIIINVPETDTVRYLALGDSYTIGQSVAISGRYPVQLVDSLRSRNVSVQNAQIIAQTGWTTANLLNGIANETLEVPYDLVSLLIGVNNQFRGKSIVEYEAEFKTLLEDAIEYAGNDKTKVFVVSIPDYGVTPYGISTGNSQQIGMEIDQFNAVNKRITDSLAIQYFDITPISRQAETDPNLTAEDNLHPSEKMYTLWVELMLAEVYEMVR
jgi:acyl-CoA thioesterase-1